MELELHKATTQIVAAYVRGNEVRPDDLPALISQVSETIEHLINPAEEVAPPLIPAVPIAKSVTPDHLICLECSSKAKMLKRHLQAIHGMMPDDYRHKWGLSHNYPMTAPNYVKLRSEMAIASRFGGRNHAKVVRLKRNTEK